MTQGNETKAADKSAQVKTIEKELQKVNENTLPEIKGELVTIETADKSETAEIKSRVKEIDISNTQSIIGFGSKAQEELQAISQDMLSGVRNKDVGPAGDSLRQMVNELRGFSLKELDPNYKPSFFQRLFGRGKASIGDFMARYETVQGQIDNISDDLMVHEHTLLKDIKSLDLLYEKTLDYYHELALYIAAGEEKLKELDETTIPKKAAQVEKATGDKAVLQAQELRDLRTARDDLERRVHDLKLTRQVTMQSLPSIRLVQENDKSLVTKINSTLVNTVPLWETQLAQAVTIHRSREAAGTVRAANDLTNELLEKNATNLRASNAEIRQEIERGVYDIETVKKAQAELIGTIEDSLRIAEEGKRKRAEAEKEMIAMESELKTTLALAKAREQEQNANDAAKAEG